MTFSLPAELADASVLVIGSGSIGTRHLRNLASLGMGNLSAADPDPERVLPMASELGVRTFADFQDGLIVVKPDIVFVCSPPVFHVEQALTAVRAGAHVFIEKPLDRSRDLADELVSESRRLGRIVQVGYNFRFNPGFQLVEQLMEEGAIGGILWAFAEFGQYLPDWRPRQDYRMNYTARKDLGGGIILDGSHELDYLVRLMGKPSAVMCMASTVNSLSPEVEGCASILMRFPGGSHATVHLDFVQRSYTRWCKLVGETGTIIWDYPGNEVRLFRETSEAWKVFSYEFEANDMYRREVEHFLTCVASGSRPLVGPDEGLAVLRIALAALRSAETGMAEALSWEI